MAKKKKKPDFGEMGSAQVRPEVSMKDLLSDDDDTEVKEAKSPIKADETTTKPKLHKTTKPESHKGTTVKPEKTKPVKETEPEKEEMERHDFFFSLSLSDEILDFMRRMKPREKNKTRMMRLLLLDFFDKTPEQQAKIYTNGLKKFKDKL